MNQQPKIFVFHLLNDRSGSPKVLSQILKHWVKQKRDIHLYTTKNKDGFLSETEGVKFYDGWYVFQPNPWLRLLYFTLSQMILIFRMWNKIEKNDIVYINTVLPFGAAILGKCKGARIIYHIHESTVNPKILKWFLLKIVKTTANDIINVSRFVQQSHNISSVPNHLVYNAIENSYVENILPKIPSQSPKNVLMVCSLKKYKGIYEFLQLAKDHPQFLFRLVMNASIFEINSFFKEDKIPSNLTLYASQKNLHPFYQWADVIVNLSRPNEWIETFGLTIIEGMAYGLPAIVPPVGGILEVLENGVTGFAVDSRDREQLSQTLINILSNNDTYTLMSQSAKTKLNMFSEEKMISAIDVII
jgi:L-malate glycosyltransferase